MTRLIILLVLISFKGFCQRNENQSHEATVRLSNRYLEKAAWFSEIPQYNYDSTLHYSDQALQVLLRDESSSDGQISNVFYHRLKYLRGAKLNLDSLAAAGWVYTSRLPDNEENRVVLYRYLMEWAEIKIETGEQQEGGKLFHEALYQVRDNKTPEIAAAILLNKGKMYYRQGRPDELELSKVYMLQALKYYTVHKMENVLEFTELNYGISGYYANVNKPDSTYYYLAQHALILPYIKDPKWLAKYYCTYGRELITNPLPGKDTISEQQYEAGRQNIERALNIISEYNVTSSTDVYAYCYGLLADLDMRKKDYDRAVANYRESYEAYLRSNRNRSAIFMLEYIAKAYEAKGDLANAWKFKEKYYQDMLDREVKRNELTLRENELQVDIQAQQQQLLQKDNQQRIFIGIMAMGLALLGLIFYNYRLKQKSSKRLTTLNHDLENKNALLDKRNAENELLLKEIHHRVKNNLEIVSSLLALQSAQIDDQNIKEAMQEGQNRVNSIGIVHQKLYQGENLGAIEMKDYFINLSENIIDTFGAHQRVSLEVAMEKLNVDVDTAVPLGLIVNELLTNTLKYAFKPGQEGQIKIKLEKQTNGNLILEVADNGVGKAKITKGTGFGSQLIGLLTRQLNGIMREEIFNGTRVMFEFKLTKG